MQRCNPFTRLTAKTKADIEAIIPVLQDWLKVRGLELNWEKTQIVPVQQGCHFLGFTIRHLKHKCLCRPQKEKVKALLKRIRDWLRANPSVTPAAVIHHLNPILRGWGNYYKHGVSKAVFSYADCQIWRAIWRWCRKRHPNKGSRWIVRKYYRTFKGRDWTFVTTALDRTGKQKTLTLVRLAEIPIQRHVKVKGTASPDDPSRNDYWQHRQTRDGKTYWDKGSKYHKVAENQNWRCPICNDPLFNGEALHTHHRVQVKNGGTDKAENLLHLHQACHHQVHQVGGVLSDRWLEPLDGTTVTSGSEGIATRSRVHICYDWSSDQDVTQCSATGTLPRRAVRAIWRCEALGTMKPHLKRWSSNREER